MPPRQHDEWYKLDNAANIFPSVSGEKNTNVFRLSCTLKETVAPETLQRALDLALKDFSHYQVIMRRGLFWFYLEHTDLTPVVSLENSRPCNRIFHKGVKELLFSVSYFGKRINLEVFHAISDGTGAMDFLRTIVYHYIVLMHGDELPPETMTGIPWESAPEIKREDSFEKHYAPEKKDHLFKQRAYTIGGTPLELSTIKVIEARTSTKAMLAVVKRRGVTLTVYLAALMLLGVYHEFMPRRARSRPIALTIPVDLRGHFASRTTRNFFSVVNVYYDFRNNPAEFDAVLASVRKQIDSGVQGDMLAGRINYTISVQKNLAARFTPLFIKHAVLSAAYRKAQAAGTCAISNLGRITMPAGFVPYIEEFSCLLNPTPQQKLKLTVNSFEDVLALGFTSNIAETGAQAWFIRQLASEGLELVISCNGGYESEIL